MSWKPLNILHSNADLANYNRSSGRFSSATELRKSVPIAVIDDENFSPSDRLAALGYRIDQLGDIRKISDVSEYSIVLCDLMGVGKFFDHQKQGASLIEEIRVHYPSIIVVAYSGSSLGSIPAKSARDKADLVLKKDIDTAEWKETLDDLARKAVDPYFAWSRIRERLIITDVDTKKIMIMEDAYVSSILKNDGSARRLTSVVSSMNLSSDIRAVVQGLVTSVVFKIMTG